MSKADFIRSLSGSTAKEVVAKGKAAGIVLSENHVHAVRANDKARLGKRPVTTKKPTSQVAVGVPANGTRSSSSVAVEELLRAVAAELGLGRALEILAGERARVRAVLGG